MNRGASFSDHLKTIPQYLVPQHFLSKLMYKLMRSKIRWLKNLIIRFIVRSYDVDVSLAENEDLNSYKCFNDFFTRKLKADARPIAPGADSFVSPVDGAISQIGAIDADLPPGQLGQGTIFQAKGQSYTAQTLLGGDQQRAQPYIGGNFCTIYLSPRDYHRIHIPCDGTLKEMIYVPGKLFSVSPATTRAVPALFARNERVVAIFETDFGPLAMVFVGAIFVSSIETVWDGVITPPYGKSIVHKQYNNPDNKLVFRKGDEIARFNMGSTVILLSPPGSLSWIPTLTAESTVTMGSQMATIHRN